MLYHLTLSQAQVQFKHRYTLRELLQYSHVEAMNEQPVTAGHATG